MKLTLSNEQRNALMSWLETTFVYHSTVNFVIKNNINNNTGGDFGDCGYRNYNSVNDNVHGDDYVDSESYDCVSDSKNNVGNA